MFVHRIVEKLVDRRVDKARKVAIDELLLLIAR